MTQHPTNQQHAPLRAPIERGVLIKAVAVVMKNAHSPEEARELVEMLVSPPHNVYRPSYK